MRRLSICLLVMSLSITTTRMATALDLEMQKGQMAPYYGVLLEEDVYKQMVIDQGNLQNLQHSYDLLEAKYKEKSYGDSFKEDFMQVFSGFLIGSIAVLMIERK
jgi:hypothetical protein